MKHQHVILRASTNVAAGPAILGGPGAAAPASAMETTDIKVEIDELETASLPRVAANRDVVSIAPVMPMKLIEPFASTAQPTAAGTEWGVSAVGADQSGFDGDGIVVAVLDTGIEAGHPAFAGVNVIEKNFTSGPETADHHGHGTHCAGTIFGRDVNGVRFGVAQGVTKALIGKVLGPGGGSSDQIVQAVQWAVDEGANVISMSLGIDFPGFQKRLVEANGVPAELATSFALEGYRQNVALFSSLALMIRNMEPFKQPALLIAAAGNESRTDVNPDFKIAVAPPAVSDGMISVAALGQGGNGFEIASFSNTGSAVSGPGVDIVSAGLGGGLTSMSGTSMATPHVAGVTALWAQSEKQMGSFTSRQVTARLIASGDASGIAPGFDPADVGSGMVKAP